MTLYYDALAFFFFVTELTFNKIEHFRRKKNEKRFTQSVFDDKLMKMMLDLNLSFRSCENESFRNFVDFLRFEVKLSDRIRFFEMIKARAKMMKKHVMNDFDSLIKVSLAFDT